MLKTLHCAPNRVGIKIKFRKMKTFEKLSMDKFSPMDSKHLGFFRGGATCATGSGTHHRFGKYSADTQETNENGEVDQTTYHQGEGDKSTAKSTCFSG